MLSNRGRGLNRGTRRATTRGRSFVVVVGLWALAMSALLGGPAMPASAATCPNESLRSAPSLNLPDCRAYEQASPTNKNGLDITGIYPVVKSSPGGDRVSFAATNGLPGGTGAQEVPLYLATRGATNWTTQGILAPESTGPNGHVIGWTPDFSQVFDRAQTLDGPPTAALLSRSSLDGSLTTILPYSAELGSGGIEYAGSSADNSKLFFEATGAQLTADAAPGKDNLYVWNTASKKLSLVGILPNGTTPPGGSFAGPYDWTRGTAPANLALGGAMRAYYTQDNHAISAEGSRVYFTAGETGQLYLRLNPTQAPSPLDVNDKCTNPALACTIQVSASRKTDGKGEGGRDIAGSRPAAFMGATPDGSKAFFTSSEKLTNDANTGLEPSPPGIARANLDGTGTNLSFLPTHALGLAVDSSHIYWADPKADAIGRANLDGTAPNPAFITGADNPQDVTVDSEHIYWTNAGDEKEETGTIGRANLDGTGASQSFITGATNPRGIDVDAAHIYWVNGGTETVARANLDGNAASVEEEFLHGASGDVAASATKIYFSRTSGIDGFIRWANLDGSGDDTIVTVPGADKPPAGLALDGSHLYWTNPGTGAIGRSNLDGTSPEQAFITGAEHPQGLATDAGHIYWSANQEDQPNPGNDLYSYDAKSGELVDLIPKGPNNLNPNGAEVKGILGSSDDGSYVYFAANGILSTVPNAQGESAVAGSCHGTLSSETGECNLYLLHEGAISFIAVLANGNEVRTDAANWTGTPTGGFASVFRFQKTARVTADGQTLLFRSQRQLSAYDNEGKPELYRYRVGEPGLLCISCDPLGKAPVSALPNTVENPNLIPSPPASTLSRELSADGNRIFFESTDALVAADKNDLGGPTDKCPEVGSELQKYRACQDVYEWEAAGTGSCQSKAQNGGCLYLLSTGQEPEPSFFVDASPSGNDVFLITRSALVRQDGDQLMDVYDARVNGGLASQNQPPPPICEAEGCKPGLSLPPASETPGSSVFNGPANPKHTRHKKKHKQQGKHKHKKQHKGKGHQHRNTHKSGRASR